MHGCNDVARLPSCTARRSDRTDRSASPAWCQTNKGIQDRWKRREALRYLTDTQMLPIAKPRRKLEPLPRCRGPRYATATVTEARTVVALAGDRRRSCSTPTAWLGMRMRRARRWSFAKRFAMARRALPRTCSIRCASAPMTCCGHMGPKWRRWGGPLLDPGRVERQGGGGGHAKGGAGGRLIGCRRSGKQVRVGRCCRNRGNTRALLSVGAASAFRMKV